MTNKPNEVKNEDITTSEPTSESSDIIENDADFVTDDEDEDDDDSEEEEAEEVVEDTNGK